MRQAWLRKGVGFGVAGAPVLGLFSAFPAKAASFSSASIAGAAPLAIAAGVVGFGLASAFLLIRASRRDRRLAGRAMVQSARLRAELDQSQAILEGMPEVTVRWSDASTSPAIFGHLASVLPSGTDHEGVLDFRRWLTESDAEVLRLCVTRLRTAGEPFDIGFDMLDGRPVFAIGRAIGGFSVLRLRAGTDEAASAASIERRRLADCTTAENLFARLDLPTLVWSALKGTASANRAARALAQDLDREQIFSETDHASHLKALAKFGGATVLSNVEIGARRFDIALSTVSDGYVACLMPVVSSAIAAATTTVAEIGAVIDAIERPVAVFDGRRQLIRANRAYAEFWQLEANYLKAGTFEQSMLDRIRTKGLLPAEVDYRAWRTEHLKSYALTEPRETLWHLPDGRAVNVSAVPMSAGGVIYVFNDLTERLALETRYNALNRVQNETLNALREGVAVFGTNGRLTLANPRLSSLFKLPINVLTRHPHIDEISAICADAMPEDGAAIWANLKDVVIDLNPVRADRTGRIRRADGRLIDWAAIRLPDGQTMLTFSDVTESANYQQVLKERNDALVTADHLKDAFVQNVSYEFRSPLTNIIGFAELLASGGAGELNERQKSYTEYIRASSTTLGVLIDNILDLATVDAGIAQLDLAPQNVVALVDKARAGLAASFAAGTDVVPYNLKIDIDPDLPEFVADGTRLVQVLYNLLSSAARYATDDSEIHLRVTSRGDDRILFIFEDDGTTLPAEVKATLTQRFDGGLNEGRQRGAGLGLTIVRSFVHLHGGTLSIEERDPRGTRITVNLPARCDEVAVSQPGAAE